MNILMVTNTFTPFVGGVERSILTFSEEYRKRGHQVIVVAPTFEDQPRDEKGVIRVPAIQHFNGTDFSVQLPVPGILTNALKDFKPDIVHSHHPYLLGDTALRIAAKHGRPVVFTFHTFYERYTHYVPLDSDALKRFVVALSTGYANLCNRVIAPSETVEVELVRRGVKTPIEVIATGIDTGRFAHGSRVRGRQFLGIPDDAFVLGFVSRLAPEKNVSFLTASVSEFMKKNAGAHFVAVGDGPARLSMLSTLKHAGLESRVHAPGTLQGELLADIYSSFDVFAFASTTETQGMVVTESLAAGVPVVALDAPGVRDVVRDGREGILVPRQRRKEFVDALDRAYHMPGRGRVRMAQAARNRAAEFEQGKCAEHCLRLYEELIAEGAGYPHADEEPWMEAIRLVRAEWEVLVNMTRATGAAMRSKPQAAAQG